MRGLALLLIGAALLAAGCGSSNSSSSAPKQQSVAQSGGGSGQTAGVSALAAATPASLCTSEGKGKPKKQCVAALKKLSNGKAKNPRAACKAMSKKKTKGVSGKSPYAVCIRAAAALMASKTATGKGNGSAAADNSGNSGDSTDTSADSSSADGTTLDSTDLSGLECVDDNGNPVSIDSPDVADCTDANDTSGGTSTDSADSSGDTSTDGG